MDAARQQTQLPHVKFCGVRTTDDAQAVNEIFAAACADATHGTASGSADAIANAFDRAACPLSHVGLVFWPKSKRFVSCEDAARIACELDPRLVRVGVFVDALVEEVASLLNAGVIDVAQLHGSEDDAYVAALRERAVGPSTSCIVDAPSGHAGPESNGTPESSAAAEPQPRATQRIWKAFEVRDANDVAAANASTADFVLLDAGKGCGRSFDWTLLAGVTRPYALAGGLDPRTLADVARAFAPDSPLTLPLPALLDVSSGIEGPPATDGGTTKSPALMARFLDEARRWRTPATAAG